MRYVIQVKTPDGWIDTSLRFATHADALDRVADFMSCRRPTRYYRVHDTQAPAAVAPAVAPTVSF